MKPYSEIYKIAAADSNLQAASSGADIWAGLRDGGRFANRTVGNILQAAGTVIDAPISALNNVINYPLYLAGKKFLGPNHGFTRTMQPHDIQLVQRITTPANRIVHQQNQYLQPDIMNNPLQKALGATALLSAGLAVPLKVMKAMKAAKPMTSLFTKAFPKYGPRIANRLNVGNRAQDKVLRTGMKIGTAANAYDIADDQLLGATYTPLGLNNPERAAAKHIIGILSAANPKAWMMKKLLRSTPAMLLGVIRPAAKLTFGPYTLHVLPTVANAGQQVYRAATAKPVQYVYNKATDYLKNDPVAQSLSNVVATSPAAKFVLSTVKPMVGYEDKKKLLNAIVNKNLMLYLNPTLRTRLLLLQRQQDMQVFGKSNISLGDVAGTLQPSTLLRTTVGQTNKNKLNMNRIFSGIPTYKAPYAPAYIQLLLNAARNGNIDITGMYNKLNTAGHAAGAVKGKYDQINNSLTPAQRAVIHNAPRVASAASSVYKRHQQQQQLQQQKLQQPPAVPAK